MPMRHLNRLIDPYDALLFLLQAIRCILKGTLEQATDSSKVFATENKMIQYRSKPKTFPVHCVGTLGLSWATWQAAEEGDSDGLPSSTATIKLHFVQTALKPISLLG